MTIYRMPVGFGPSLGPRQGPDGRRFNGEHSRATVLTVEYLTDADAMAALLPPGFTPAPEPVVSVNVHYNHSLAWLAGRAYNYIEVLFRSTFEGERDRVEGNFVAVMWESLADPIIAGREEVGHPKLFADIPDPAVTAQGTTFEASWFGYRFCTVRFDGLSLPPWPADREERALAEPPATGLAGLPRLNHKYIPNSADLTLPDVSYVVMMPAGLYEHRVLDSWKGSGSVEFREARWEDLPTMANIATAMARLPVREWRGASMVRTLRAFNDLRDVMRVVS
ncbi:acetoacetate decarboxylase family protein [Phytohabitans sp. ZYX-F-186]|uniref:Acetoacetate decarboxylase family protein n=1 Tax=Phytohabitans maris TaxID=3071409 RepID=A0ABU0ZWB1_9ACTN|nr:acetoacetate decarboxylase family protein [Phytohabitans sp. ZYX-F-186]MDQ7911277.1 acetoacetate decarboxylase family protein [Phytohabitans sp. ZYX-F-186]